jgi:hypothetical protein
MIDDVRDTAAEVCVADAAKFEATALPGTAAP